MKTLKKAGVALCLSPLFVVPAIGSAQETIVKSYIGTAMIQNVRYHASGFFGGCVAYVNVNVNTAGSQNLTGTRANGGDCTSNLVTFGCTGDFGSKTDAKNAFDVAQLAYVTGVEVAIQVTNQDANGACFADFVQTK